MWYLLCLIPLLIFIPFGNDFIFIPGTSLSDITISHYPNLLFIQKSVQSGAGIPLWSPNILSGYPFIADPLSGLHYPPGWLALLFPLPFGFNLIAALHLVFGALGMYLFLRSEGLRPQTAAMMGLAFALLPKLCGHFAAGHLTLIYAISWTPWLLLVEKRWQESFRWRSLWRSPGVILGVIALADPRWVIYSGVLWFAYSIKNRSADRVSIKRALGFLSNLIVQGFLALAISAALLLPLSQFTSFSTRITLSVADMLDQSLPFSGMINVFFPTTGGNVEWIAYPGAVILALILTGLSVKVLRRVAGFWLWLVLGATILALGSGIPGMDILSGIPGLNLLRIPARWIFIVLICLVIATGFILDGMLKMKNGKRHINLIALIGLNTAILVFTIGGSLLAGKPVIELVLANVGILLATVVILLFGNNKITGRVFSLALLGVLLINLFSVDWNFMGGKSSQAILSQSGEVAYYIRQSSNLMDTRVYSPSYSLPQQTAIFYDLQLADGVNPLQLSSYVSFMENATGVPLSGYSVTLPDFASGEPSTDNTSFIPDPTQLGLLNVCFIVSEFDIQAEGLTILEQFGTTRVYRNQDCLPRAWIQNEDTVQLSVTIQKYTANRISIQAEGPGQLILSEIMYPGWLATVDGEPVTITPYMGLLRSVPLVEGWHEVVFSFKPMTAFIGASISLTMFLALVILLILEKVNPK